MSTVASKPQINRKKYRRFPPVNINLDIQIKSKKTASYFTLTLSLLSLSFFGLFAIRPTISTAVSLNKNIQDLKKLNIQYEEKIGSLIRAQSEYEKIRNDLHLIEQAVPANASFNKLLQGIEKFASVDNLSITQLQIDTAPVSTLSSSAKTNNYGFNLSATGKYPSVYSFISHLIYWKRIVTISAIDLEKEVSSPGANIRFVLKGTAYYEP